MNTIAEYGFIVPDTENFEQIKAEIDSLGRELRNAFFKKDTMHAILFRGTLDSYFTCHITNGDVKFGIYNSGTKTLSRTGNANLLRQIDKRLGSLLTKRLELACRNKIQLSPLHELWELSIERERLFTDNNNLTYLSDPHLLDVRIEPKELEEIKEI